MPDTVSLIIITAFFLAGLASLAYLVRKSEQREMGGDALLRRALPWLDDAAVRAFVWQQADAKLLAQEIREHLRRN